MDIFTDPGSRAYARLTGAFYLSIAVAGGFAIAYVPSQIVVQGDALATVGNILSRRGLYMTGIGADALVMLLEIMTLTMLYFMFRPVNATLAFASAMARLMMVAVMAAMLFFHAGALALADPAGRLSEFTAAERADLAGLLLDMHHAGVWIWQIFFTLHLVLLGALVARSGRFPRVLGYGLMVGGTGYLADSIHAFAAPGFEMLGTLRIGLLAIVTISEIGFALWLLIRGPRAAASTLAHA